MKKQTTRKLWEQTSLKEREAIKASMRHIGYDYRREGFKSNVYEFNADGSLYGFIIGYRAAWLKAKGLNPNTHLK